MRHLYTLGLAAGLAALVAAPAAADPAAGEAAFGAQDCLACHYVEGPAREQTIADQIAKTGPELWYAGDKFQRPWLEAWLQDPQPIRPLKYNSITEENPGDHPAMSADDATNVTDFLMTLVSDVVEAGVIEPRRNLKGQQIFTKRMPCSGCHQYPGRREVEGGLSGPSLADAGNRLNPDWIIAYMRFPKVFKPVKPMPVFVDILSDDDLIDVSTFVAILVLE